MLMMMLVMLMLRMKANHHGADLDSLALVEGNLLALLVVHCLAFLNLSKIIVGETDLN